MTIDSGSKILVPALLWNNVSVLGENYVCGQFTGKGGHE